MTLLVKNALAIVSCDQRDRIYKNSDLLLQDGVIKEIASNIQVSDAKVVDARGCVVYPGLVNTHHHLYQTFSRNVPAVQNFELFAWLKALYAVWQHMDEDVVYYAAMVGLADLIKNGATTVFDHHYVFNAKSDGYMDALFRAAADLGVRLHASRGSMSRSVKDGGLPPDSVVQTTDKILQASEEAVKKYHNPDRYSFQQVVLAPCSPFSVTPDLMLESARLARKLGVRLHTHLAETRDESAYVVAQTGMRPLAYMESLEWTGPDVWYAHGIHFNDAELQTLAATKTGVAHCPVSNMKLASGACRVRDMLDLAIPLGLAVDGSASNDGSNLMAEIRSSYLLHRLQASDKAPSGAAILKIATAGGAAILGRDDIGTIAEGMAADLCIYDVQKPEFVGTTLDVAAIPALIGFTGPAAYTICGGRVIAENGKLAHIDEDKLTYQANAAWERYLQRAGMR